MHRSLTTNAKLPALAMDAPSVVASLLILVGSKHWSSASHQAQASVGKQSITSCRLRSPSLLVHWLSSQQPEYHAVLKPDRMDVRSGNGTVGWLQVEKLLEQYENIIVELSEAAALQEKHAAATAWAAEAQHVLDRGRPFADEDAAMLEVWIPPTWITHPTSQSLLPHFLCDTAWALTGSAACAYSTPSVYAKGDEPMVTGSCV